MESLSILKVKRGRVQGSMTRLVKFSESSADDTTINLAAIEARLVTIERYFNEYHEFNNEIMTRAVESNLLDEKLEKELELDFTDFETQYFNAKSALLNIFKSLSPSTGSSSNTSSLDISNLITQQAQFLEKISDACFPNAEKQLSKIQIKQFSGNYSEWTSFHDLYCSTVHNNTRLTPIQKFHYLKSFLKDESAQLLNHIAVTDDNYTEAWEKLKSRYHKPGRIANSYIDRFMSLHNITEPTAINLRSFADTVYVVLRGLKALDEERDIWLIHILLNKLDEKSRTLWTEAIQSWPDEEMNKNFPKIGDFLKFLETRCLSLESNVQCKNRQSKLKNVHLSNSSCPQCNVKHALHKCPEFRKLNIIDRRALVKQKSLCFNCLRVGHKSSNCKSKHSCRKCNKRHHSLNHLEQSMSSQKQQSTSASSLASDATNISSIISTGPVTNHFASNNSAVSGNSVQNVATLLRTATAFVIDCFGQEQLCRIILDSGSQASFINEQCVRRLGLNRKHARISVSGLYQTGPGVTKGIVNLQLRSRLSNKKINLNAFILNRITSSLPCTSFSINGNNIYSSLELADLQFNNPSEIDILLGADKFFAVLEHSSLFTRDGFPDAFLTIFGWVIGGDISQLDNVINPTLSSTIVSLHAELDLDTTLRHFWELEEEITTTGLNEDEQNAETNFILTHNRTADGKYQVELPFKFSEPIEYGNTFAAAVKRFESLERRFTLNQKLKLSYLQFINEYLELNHMTEIEPPVITSTNCYYLPYHAVFKEDNSTTKLRLVFDGTTKYNITTSLNETLLSGPPVQRDLFSVCLRFRRNRYVLTGDIEKMYRQIWVADKHRPFQRIIWRNLPNDKFQHFELNTVTYGTSCAPYLAVRTLRQLAIDCKQQYPMASQILEHDVYVDDAIISADSIEKLDQSKEELIRVLSSAGFRLQKFRTNCWPTLISLPESDRELTPFEFKDENSVKVLELRWFPTQDYLSYRVTIPEIKQKISKRQILSESSKIFDPIGLLSPSTIAVKILFQELWLYKLDWDDILPETIANNWLEIRNELPIFETIKIRRCAWLERDSVELHAFCDASQVAYAAVVYSRSIIDDNITIEIIAAKTRVAPLKPVSLARLELCAALLLCKLVKKIKLSLQSETIPVFAWTDSQIVLYWLSAPPRRWATFIANRTSEILDIIPRKYWNHVKTQYNPADCASRGLAPSILIKHDLWWNGPSWLHYSPDSWETTVNIDISHVPIEQIEELQAKIHHIIAETDPHPYELLLCRVSSWLKATRAVAYCYRFFSNLRVPVKNRIIHTLDVTEVEAANIKLFVYAQHCSFANEIKFISAKKLLPISSKLLPLTPFIDNNGCLRVGGRIKHSNLPFSTQHPIILSAKHRVTYLIALYDHEKNLHVGSNQLFFLLKQQFWIIGSRNLLRKIVHQCIYCFRQRQSSLSQIKADLPASRITYSRPFKKTGVDFAGPITVRTHRGRNPRFSKGYISLFFCFTTKAMHLELVGDLSTDAFLDALDRFIARRGKPSEIINDNANNFKGLQRKTNDLFQHLLSQHHEQIIIDHLSKYGTMWRTISPYSPHHGCLWESGMRSVKLHLKRVISNHILTYEEMYTLLVRIEGLLNSRPICVRSDDTIDALTPAHFLIDQPYMSIPEPMLAEEDNILSNKNWELLKGLTQGFWRRWHQEYLTSLQTRPKWQQAETSLKVNDIVVVKVSNQPPAKWILGKCISCHPGNDGHLRVATVQTSTETCVRPITKLVPLPLYAENSESFSGRQDVLE